ncbi:AlpA family transcriptional regulator [Ralstonia pseudosolanacearum]|uniref:helix-turn-helix transcriptional regulator n=1 Tax=Ralstonia pseudosolanacearum TaxID=1310165 RepID=UPI002002A830|nr:AlpA family transcriptional regulator [Ralstonia pseudosolanacearum]MCK4124521.1 AlpA family transcriptional regulator [Ralstonia pseudosolanacearum]
MHYPSAHAHSPAGTHSSAPATTERFLRLPEVMSTCGLCRSSIYQKVSTGEFPQPVRLTRSSIAWVASEIQQWVAARIAARQS